MPDTPRRPGGLRLLVTVTFNPNQLRSHLLPLIALDEVESITLVADVAPPLLPKLRSVVPTPRARRLLGRAGAKLALCRRLARAERFDWVMGFNFVPHGFNAQLVARRAGTRSMYHMIGGAREWLDGGHASENRVLSRLPLPSASLEKLLLRQIRRATLVAAMGEHGRADLVRRGVDASRVVVVPPSTDLERFAPSDHADRRYDLVTVGRLTAVKRQQDILEAAARLGARHGGLRIALAGDGPREAMLEERARQLGLGDAVELLGRVDAVEELYARSRVLVIASESEGMPIAMLDAMASGLPVVASDVGEIGTLVSDGRNGFVYPAGDVDALAGRLDAILSDDALARSLGRAAREDVGVAHSVDAVSAVYRRLLLGAR